MDGCFSVIRVSFLAIALLGLAMALAGPGLAQKPPPAPTPIPGIDPRTEIGILLEEVEGAIEKGEHSEGVIRAESLWARAEITLGHEDLGTAAVLEVLGHGYLHLDRLEEAENVLQRVVDLRSQQLGPRASQTVEARIALTQVYHRQGRLAEAEQLTYATLAIIDQVPELSGLGAAATAQLGTVLFSQGRPEDAEATFQQALEQGEQILGPDQKVTIFIAALLAELKQQMGKYAEAEYLLRRVAEVRLRLLGEAAPETNAAFQNLASFLIEQGRTHDGEQVVMPLVVSAKGRWGSRDLRTVKTEALLGELRAAQGQYREAEQIFAGILENSRAILGDDHRITLEAAARLALSRLQPSLSGANALEPARIVMAGLERRRRIEEGAFLETLNTQREAAALAGFAANMPEITWSARESLPRSHSALVEEAFEAMQQATSSPASSAVIRMALRNAVNRQSPALAGLMQQRDALELQWRANSERYSSALAADESDVAGLRQQMLWDRMAVDARIRETETAIGREFPAYFDLIQPRSVSVEETQKLLGPHEALLIVVPGEIATHIICIDANGAQQIRSALTAERIDAHVRRLLWDVGANVLVSQAEDDLWHREAGPGYSFDRQTAHLLYRELIGPFADRLRGTRHLYIVAGGSLSSLPFSLLVSRQPQGDDANPADLRATHWLADEYALVQMPSVQSLQYLRRFGSAADESKDETQALIGFGDPTLAGSAEQRGRVRGGRGVGRLPPRSGSGAERSATGIARLKMLNRLPGTAIELEAIRKVLKAPPDALFTGSRATERNLRSVDLSHARVIVLATHGLLGGEIEGLPEPGLVLTPPLDRDENDDGYLMASEVSTLRLNAEWVILSACNTAAGDGSAGASGLSGLARAFFFAGARNILASHWPVRDTVAPRLTVRTIELTREDGGLSRAEALQRAMREVREDASHDTSDDSWAHPGAWAPFVLIGDAAL